MFSPVKNKKVYEYIIEQIQGMIMSGQLKRGDRLPSERDLSEQFNVSRTSVREALRALDVIGLVEVRQGGGNYVRADLDQGLFQPLPIMFMLQQSKPEEIFSLRRAIEIEAVELAAQRIMDSELDELEKLLEELRKAPDENVSARVDKELHYKIAKASGNQLLLNSLNVVSVLVEQFIRAARTWILAKESNKNELLQIHETIIAALAKHDKEQAVSSMRKHFEIIEAYMVKGSN